MIFKRFYLVLSLFLITTVHCYSQSDPPYSTLQRVIPATPEAMSLGQVGFSDINLYTGKANYSLPIYTVTQNGISFPITLSYTGGGGVKVEEVGSSVGLGWNLSSSGGVSRVIRGVADDTYASGVYVGYMHLPDFPPVDNEHYTDYKKYAESKYDGQPDLFSVSVAGVSAQFYINKNKKVVFVEKSDLKVTPTITEYAITAFTVKDMNGRTYYFNEQEKSKSEPVDNTYAEYEEFNTSSWYLTKITSEYGKDIITFTYQSGENNQIKQELRSPYQYRTDMGSGTFSEDASSFSQLTYKRPVLQKISFASGEVNFNMSDSMRYDMAQDEYVKSVVVKNYLGDTIKHFNFYHSYFSTTGVIQQGQGTHYTYGNSALRLKLDSLQEASRTNQKLTYKFLYDTTHYLPDRMTTFAMDHWGYYNGESGNTTWEANNRIKYYFLSGDSALAENGSANREPNLAYTKAGVLTKVITPTKGEIHFDYELNSSTDSRLPNS